MTQDPPDHQSDLFKNGLEVRRAALQEAGV
jgi:hypothetical protein